MLRNIKTTDPSDTLEHCSEEIEYTFNHNSHKLKIVCSILCSDFSTCDEAEDWVYPMPPFSRFFIFKEGGAKIITSAGEILLEKGKVYHVLPHQPFEATYYPSELIFYHLYIYNNFACNIFENDAGIPFINDSNLYNMFIKGHENNDKFLTYSALTQAVGQFIQPHMNEIVQTSKQNKKFKLFFDYLDNNPPAAIRIEDIASLYSVTRATISKRFQRKMHISLKDYLIKYTVKSAQEMLLQSDTTIDEVAENLGFASVEYFYKFFKNHTDLTPMQFKNS